MVNKKIPTEVYAEMTPNPSTMKYVANRFISNENTIAEFLKPEEARGNSPLAEELFNFPFVKSVFIASNFVTVTKVETIEWELITNELRCFIREYLHEGKEVLKEGYTFVSHETVDDKGLGKNTVEPKAVKPNTPAEEKIIALIDEYVQPAVEGDGGAIHFKSFENGVVKVILRGSCSGCPSSTVTLQSGIKNLLMQHLAEVKDVIAEEV